MGLFGWKKTKQEEEKKKADVKPAKVVSGGKENNPRGKKSMKDIYAAKAGESDKGEKGGKIKKKDDGAGQKSMKDLYGSQSAAPSGGGKTGTEAPKMKGKKRGHAYRLIIKPLVTEKAANLGTESKYVFEVATSANKIEIAGAIYEAYGIRPVSVNIARVGGKTVKYGRIKGKRKDWKKAIVTLPAGQTIDIYEGV